MRISRTGLVLNLIYLVIVIGCVVWAQFVSDPKGKFIILQIPVVLQHGLLLLLDATHLLHNLSWAEIYLVLGIPMMFLLMVCGAIIDFIGARVSSAVGAGNESTQQGGGDGSR